MVEICKLILSYIKYRIFAISTCAYYLKTGNQKLAKTVPARLISKLHTTYFSEKYGTSYRIDEVVCDATSATGWEGTYGYDGSLQIIGTKVANFC